MPAPARLCLATFDLTARSYRWSRSARPRGRSGGLNPPVAELGDQVFGRLPQPAQAHEDLIHLTVLLPKLLGQRRRQVHVRGW